MRAAWSQELERLSRAEELQIAVRRREGTLRRWVPIWVVGSQRLAGQGDKPKCFPRSA